MITILNYTYPLFRPPAEAESLIFQITNGCSFNQCKFCGMYKKKQFCINPIEGIFQDMDKIPAFYKSQVRKIFLADGDALVCGHSMLMEISDRIIEDFPKLRRIAIYASPGNINKLSEKKLSELKNNKISLFYIGLESGHDPLLDFIKKGNTACEFVQAMEKLNSQSIKTSVTAILGLGGKKFTKFHARDTARVINKTSPSFFSLLTLIKGGNENYIRSLELLNRYEILEEVRDVIKGIDCKTIFRTNHSSNFVDLGGSLPKDKNLILRKVEHILSKNKNETFFKEIPQHLGEASY